MNTANQISATAYRGSERLCAPWAAAGLYLPSFDPGHGDHELTQKIRLSKVSRRHDRELADLLTVALVTHLSGFTPDLVFSIPCKPGHEDRFRHIRRMLATRAGAGDGEAALSQTRVVEGYRQLHLGERRARGPGRFAAQASVRGRDVLLIDDVITSGAQATDAIRALKAAGADTVAFLAIAEATWAPRPPVYSCWPCPGSRQRVS